MSEQEKNATIAYQLRSEYDVPLAEIAMHKTDLAFSKCSFEKDPIYLGMEWEVSLENMGVIPQAYLVKEALRTPIKDYLNYSHGGYPIELRSIPATAQYHKQYLTKYMFDAELNKHFKVSESAGIHIHIDKRHFTESSLKKFMVFVCHEDNRSFIEEIGGRKLSNKWCRPVYLDLKYMKDGKTIRGTGIKLNQSLQKYILTNEPSGKNAAVNTHTDYKTVEFRIFATQTTEQKVLKNLEFTDALVRFCREVSYNKLTPEYFAQYVLNNSDKYEFLLQEPCMKTLVKGKKPVVKRNRIEIKTYLKGKVNNAKNILAKAKANYIVKKSKVS